MTCYETLRASAPAADAPMANHFVKWWRNKIRNGYKKISIGSDGERTDTEELVGCAASQCSAPPDLLPSEVRARLQPAPQQPRTAQLVTTTTCELHTTTPSPKPAPATEHQATESNDKNHGLRFEELTCDVELQHPESSKQQPLQFSFTLYDLDGHGRMTKDDIAGIVSTIYDAIGKSVTVPHYGSKTVQVRLTVVPEERTDSTQSENRNSERRQRRKEPRVQPPQNDTLDHSDDEPRDRLSPDDDATSKSSSSVEHRPVRRHTSSKEPRPHRQHNREKRDRKQEKRRSGSLQRRELLEIIQANMEKNHLSFQATRKPSDSIPYHEDEITSKHHKPRNRAHTVNEKTTHTFQNFKHEKSGHGHSDLAGGGDSNLCRYDRYLHAVICSSARHTHTGYHQRQAQAQAPRPTRAHHRHHGRSRSHDLPGQVSSTPQQPRVLQIIFL